MTIGFAAATGSQVLFEANSGIWPFGLFTLIGAVAFGLSLPLAFTGRGFDLAAHRDKVATWSPAEYPPVNVFLPICGEPLQVLEASWRAVAAMMTAYPGKVTAYVLDDGADPAARELARGCGLRYVVRPDRGAWKKSGNLRYAFAHTAAPFFVVLDADFGPRPDFLTETLPYFDDPAVAIVQTPQFFRQTRGQTWVESAAGAIQELFYRAIQTGRDRLGASICVGTCAVYRRRPLTPQGGTTLIAYAEDVHTGLDVRRGGWQLRYIPIVLAAGMCPAGLNAFFRQQYRWCTGSTSTILTGRLWSVPMTRRARATYLSGFAYYLFTAVSVFAVPLIPITLLIFRPTSISPANSVLITVAMAVTLTVLPLWHLSRYDPRQVLPLSLARSWAHALAIWDYTRGRTMGWQATGAGVEPVTRFWWGVRVWNGGTVTVWLTLACWRATVMQPSRFFVVIACGLLNAAIVARVIWPGRDAA